MEEKRVYIKKFSPAPYVSVIEVIDVETGEVLISKREDDVAQALAHGKIAYAQMEVRDTYTEDGRLCRTAATKDGFILSVWQRGAKQPPKRGGKRSYVKVQSKMLKLDKAMQQALLALGLYICTSGKLSDSSRRRPLSSEAIFSLWGCSKTKGYALLRQLKQAGAIIKHEGAYFVSREYMSRG